MKRFLYIFICLELFFTLSLAAAWAAIPLPKLAINVNETSVSGLSSGAFMTSQFYLSYSDIMVGAGIVAGGPYLCAQSWVGQDYLTNATTACMKPLTPMSAPNTPLLEKLTKKLDAENLIDPLVNLANDKIYLFSGHADQVVSTNVVNQTQKFYKDLGVPAQSLRYVTNVDAGHALITADKTDSTCNITQPPFINNCGFNQAWDILNFIYANLTAPGQGEAKGKIIEFNQTEFIDSPYSSMSASAFVYVPDQCRAGGCKLHIVFHGCLQGAAVIGDHYYAKTGYNPIADANNFIVLYPQVQPSTTTPFNPQGCWDFWGYSDPISARHDYFSKQAPQIRAVRAMVTRLSQPAQ
ncbi:MAG TPA: hypothetical protein VIZ65_06355 [Cellvibrionaceae bacterium]